MTRRRKPLDEKGKEFIYQDKTQNFEQALEQTTEQQPPQSILSEILPESKQPKEQTQRFCVDLPESLAKKLAKISKKSGVAKTEIVRRLLIKALSD